ncbi:MAG: flagellar hook-basal body complex protein [Alphaproteobacteria bacterium]|nr:flagellar hook-basal body complex protein [Alphaproteobacteria bacterium]
MSLFGALRTGVSGLTAQSSAMSIISDNIANVNTVGYKANSASFSTLVTKQISTTLYSSGGVQCRTRAGVDVQGLLNSTTYSTDLGISGSGFFVTTQSSNPGASDLWSYTRVGNFSVDQEGFLRNDNGYYLQAWPLQTFDGEENAAIVKVGNNMYIKAYTDDLGSTVYVNDNIIDGNNLRPINLNTMGGTAQETQNVSFGANLPADAPVFDPVSPENGGRYNSSVLIYDSLGNSHNATLTFTKTDTNEWSLDIGMPSGAATFITHSNSEVINDVEQDVYAARAQLEFNSIPANHSNIAMEVNGTNYVFEFTTDDTTSYSPKINEKVIAVDLSSGVVTTDDAVQRLNQAIQANFPGAGRFRISSDGATIEINQSTSGAAIKFKVATTSCLQASANPDPISGIPSGQFELPEIDWDIKNVARIDFSSENLSDYLGKSVTIGMNSYLFTDTRADAANGIVPINISTLIDNATGKIDTVKLVSLLKQAINNNEPDYTRYVASGSTLEINPTAIGTNILVSSGNSASVTFQTTNIAAYIGQTVTIGDIAGNQSKRYEFTANPGIESGTILADGNTAVNIGDLFEKDRTPAVPIAVMNALYNTMKNYYESTGSVTDLSNYIQINGATIVSTGDYLSATDSSASVNKDTLTFTSVDFNDYNNATVTIDNTTYTLTSGTSNSTTIDLDTLINTQTLTFTAIPVDGDTVTINNTQYQFVTETDTLSLSNVPAENDIITVNGTNYKFVSTADNLGATPKEISIGGGRSAADIMTVLANDIGETADGASLTLDRGSFAIVTCAAASITENDVGQNQIGLYGVATADGAMNKLAAAAHISAGSVSGASVTLSGKAFSYGNTTPATVTSTVNPGAVMEAVATLANVSENRNAASLSLTALEPNHAISSTVANITLNTELTTEPLKNFETTTGIGKTALNITGKDNGQQTNQPDSDGLLVLTNKFGFNNVENAQSGSLISAVSFNADGTPKQVNTNKIQIEWANGASDMTDNYYESSQINLYLGDANTANGLTQLAGKFTTNYVSQDGAKYGNYTGVAVSKDGIVTAIFDNGETRAIAQIPLATFVDVNSLEALTGNSYIETTASGNATLRTAGEGGAGVISSNSLEQSTVDIAEEFTDMITTQRAYSAASKIITTADSMLDELINIKR